MAAQQLPKTRKDFDTETKSLIAEAAMKGKTTITLGGVERNFEEFTAARGEVATLVYASGEDQRGRALVEGDGHRFRGGMVRLTEGVIEAITEVTEDHSLLRHVTDSDRKTGYLVAWNEQGDHVTVSPTVKNS